MPDTKSTFQLRERDPADIENASEADQYRVFLSSITGLLTLKDNAGNVTTIGGLQTVATNMVQLNGPATYAASILQTILADPSGGSIDVDLPAVAGFDGQLIEVVNITGDVTPISVNANGAENIIGDFGTAPSYDLNTPYERRYLRASEALSAWIITG